VLTYAANLKASTYEVPGVMKKAYTYYNDGQLKFTQDQLTANSKFDRLYRYDHVGRATIALSGLEAREQGTTDDRPYNETMSYDALGHLTSREVRQWDRHELSLDTYSNNRRIGWTYDADGRMIVGANQFTYDAAGRITRFGFADPYETDQQFDGDGERAKTTLKTYDLSNGQLLSQEVTYLVKSTVLGQVVSEVRATGAKQQSFVYAGGNLMAIQKVSPNGAQGVEWSTYDASGASYHRLNLNGFNVQSAEMDSFGANAGLFKPVTWPTPDAPGKIEPFYGVPELNGATLGCVLDRIPVPCDMVANLKEAGGVVNQTLVRDEQGFWKYERESYESHGLGLYTTKPYQVVELGNGQKPLKPVDFAVLQNSIDTCVTELWPWFDMTSIKYTDAPGKGGKDDDKYNGVTTLHDAEYGKTFEVTNDPTPPPDAKADIAAHDARGRTDRAQPFWTYAYPQGSAAKRPSERRYPELFGDPSMLYIRVQIHELGVSLSAIRDIYHPGPGQPVLDDRGLDPGHGDDGPALEDCVGRKYYAQMSLTPKSKP
jgi:hypothetical protein